MCNQLLFHSTYDSKWRIFETFDCLLDEGNNLKTSLCAPGNFNEQFFHFIDIFETKSIMKIMVSCSTIMKKMKRITSYIFVLICNRSALQGWVHYITKGRCTAHRHPSGHNANTVTSLQTVHSCRLMITFLRFLNQVQLLLLSIPINITEHDYYMSRELIIHSFIQISSPSSVTCLCRKVSFQPQKNTPHSDATPSTLFWKCVIGPPGSDVSPVKQYVRFWQT